MTAWACDAFASFAFFSALDMATVCSSESMIIVSCGVESCDSCSSPPLPLLAFERDEDGASLAFAESPSDEAPEPLPSEADRRQTNVVASEAGRATLENVPDALQQRYVRAFDRLEDWEQAQLVSSLERVAAMLNAEGLDASPVLTTGEIHAPRKRG